MRYSFKKGESLVRIVILILLIVFLNFYQKELRSFFYSFSAPLEKVLFRAGERTDNFLKGVFKTSCLKNEVDELQLKNQELLSQLVALEELKKENEVLRNALGLELQKDFKLSLTQIIGKDISQDFILIDRGSKDGILENMPVITGQGVLAGRISEVYDKFSKVMLLSNKDSSFDAKIGDISGVVKGQGNFKILLDLISREEIISQNDIVITSALAGIFPKGLLVGKVKKVKKNDLEPFQQAEIEPFFDISRTEILFIISEF